MGRAIPADFIIRIDAFPNPIPFVTELGRWALALVKHYKGIPFGHYKNTKPVCRQQQYTHKWRRQSSLSSASLPPPTRRASAWSPSWVLWPTALVPSPAPQLPTRSLALPLVLPTAMVRWLVPLQLEAPWWAPCPRLTCKYNSHLRTFRLHFTREKYWVNAQTVYQDDHQCLRSMNRLGLVTLRLHVSINKYLRQACLCYWVVVENPCCTLVIGL